MADESTSQWTRPSAVMLKRKKRASIQHPSPQSGGSQMLKVKSVSRPSPQSVKRRNPFSCSASKRRVLSESSNTEEPEIPSPTSNLFKVLDANHSETTQATADSRSEILERLSDVINTNIASNAQTDKMSSREVTKEMNEQRKEQQPKYFDHYPVDWSLRTKLRCISSKPFNWCCQMSSAEECSGTVAFVQGTDSADEEASAESTQLNASWKREFKQLTCYWMHPNLPWFKLFPRISADSKAGRPSAALQDDAVQSSLMSDWCESLTSAFQHLRCGYCPYFYLCCHHLTVLFRAAGVAGHPDMHALITPTSRGFRNVLKEEGIEFSMPLNPHYKTSKEAEDGEEENAEPTASQSGNNEDQPHETLENNDAEDEDDLDDADDAASSWLQDLGLDAAKFKSLDPKKIKLQKEGFRHIDQRPESVIVVEGSDCQALFNYLLNSTNLVSPTGWQAGIPPTIIAPAAFKGATLKTHQVKSGIVRRAVGEEPAYSLEVLGPILPSCLDGVLNLMSHTQESYVVSFSVHEPSTSLNALPDQNTNSDSDICCEKAAVPASHLRKIVKNYDLKKYALREVNCESSKFGWIL